jgi:ABC-type bacteriocin/lantibiotic exporter with double-glycine peptidase domain
MELLSIVVVSGLAVGYVVELTTSLLGRLFSPRIIRAIVNLPLSLLSCYLLGVTSWPLVVTTLASGFISLAVILLVNRPSEIQQVNRRR